MATIDPVHTDHAALVRAARRETIREHAGRARERRKLEFVVLGVFLLGLALIWAMGA